jgi:hypothetical protein
MSAMSASIFVVDDTIRLGGVLATHAVAASKAAFTAEGALIHSKRGQEALARRPWLTMAHRELAYCSFRFKEGAIE